MKVIYIGNPILRNVSESVKVFDDDLRAFVKELSKTMYVEDGVGLAAPQVAVSRRIFVYDPGDGLRVVINPEILSRSDETVKMEEGCLSIPGIYADIYRPSTVRIHYRDEYGQHHEEDLTDYPARIVQHESDHLEGVLFVDYLSASKRAVLKPKLNQIIKESTR
ncbi:MAG: Peptide deformylase [Mesotoga infera]|uniref:Peptide deformylase n=1 Tax=Mesotoga infera TaxID=1236046 RepID=A0A101H005_9BACT|nr:MAG: Peptide deformylase [Mesotoga infera]KUK90105.1 MAG: Peptide deformylase [Mesotoga infera]